MAELAADRSRRSEAIADSKEKPDRDIEANQGAHTTTGDSDSLPTNISIIEEDDEDVGGRPPARSHSKEAEIARQEAAQTVAALKKLPDDKSPIFWSHAKKVNLLQCF